MEDLKKLKLLATNIRVLYVEDNERLRENASRLLHKFFDTIDIAVDGQDGLQMFKEHHHSLVITDIKMPNMDGISMSKEIKTIQPNTKIIIMSAFDDKEYLYQAIELDIFRFLKKPVNLSLLTDILYEALKQIKYEQELNVSTSHTDNLFDYQSSMALIFDGDKPIVANQIFLDFFKTDNIETFVEKYGDLGLQFIEHDGFLYNKLDKTWFEEMSENEKKHFHVKIKNRDGQTHHLILMFQNHPDKDGHGILSLEDVTDLNLLTLLDKQIIRCGTDDNIIEDSDSMFELLKMIQQEKIKVEMHNYYKGLSITNNAVVTQVKEKEVVIHTTYLQEKAMQFEGKTIIVSQMLPHAIECSKVVGIGFEKEYVELKSLKFIKTSPIARKTIRVIPEDNHTATLFIGDNQFEGEVRVGDISLDAVKFNLKSLPPGLDGTDDITLNIVLEMDDEPFIVNTKATVLRKSELASSFSVVFMFKELKKTLLVKYITKRQMAIIREFKGLQNG